MATFTFDAGLSTQKDEIRLRVGDNNGQPQWFLADETYNALLTKYPNQLNEVSSQACSAIAALCAQMVSSFQEGKQKVEYQKRTDDMLKLGKYYRDQASADAGPVQTGAAFASMQSPDLRGYTNSLTFLGDPNDPTRKPPAVP